VACIFTAYSVEAVIRSEMRSRSTIRTYLAFRSRDVSKKTLKNEPDVTWQLLDYPVSRGVLLQLP
jgi:hypothetical protein